MRPKISIIIPVYNAEKFLSRALNAVLCQSLQEIEVICVNDGSRDNSLGILNAYSAKDQRIKIINQENKGSGGARNSGLNQAQGDYILFMDADDTIEANYCQAMYIAALDQNADIVVVGIKKIYPNYSKNRFTIQKEEALFDMPSKFKAAGCPQSFYIMNKLFRREPLEALNLRFDENVTYEDVMYLTVAVTCLGKMVTLKDIYYNYINQSQGVTKSTQTPKKQNDRYLAHKKMVEYCHNNNIPLEKKYQMITKRYWDFLGFTMLKIKEYKGCEYWRLFDVLTVFVKKD